jgi:hypothetical protein
MIIEATVQVDLGPLSKFSAQLESDLSLSSSGPIRKAFKQWAARYRAFLQERFSRLSRGGGEWPPLSPATIAGRKQGKGSKKFAAGTVAILIDTGTLWGALDPTFTGKPGQLEDDIPFGIEVGFGGRKLHPGSSSLTVEDIAMFHQLGGPHLPQRTIVVPPDDALKQHMAGDMERAIKQLAKESGC